MGSLQQQAVEANLEIDGLHSELNSLREHLASKEEHLQAELESEALRAENFLLQLANKEELLQAALQHERDYDTTQVGRPTLCALFLPT